MKILANDGISKIGIEILERSGHEVITTKVAQEKLIDYINQEEIDIIIVRSATKVKKDIIENCPSLKIIGRGGVGMDNIDVNCAKNKGLIVINTPKSSAISVAELVFSHLMGIVRFLHDSNRNMPLEGDKNFGDLKKRYANGTELYNKTLGIIGFGTIGKEVAKRAIALGMNVVFCDSKEKKGEKVTLELSFFNGEKKSFILESYTKRELLKISDFISINTPYLNKPILSKKEFEIVKQGVGIINTSRGELIDEQDLLEALNSNKIAFVGLDVFKNEPNPNINILMNPKISLTPHIGGSTIEAQERIGEELANQILEITKK